MMTRRTLLALIVGAVVLTACGGERSPGTSEEADASGAPPAAGACLEGATECADMPTEAPPGPPDGDGDAGAIDEAAIIQEAESLIGRPEDEVLAASDDRRLGRHGDEHLALTEDYVLGRKTIATEDDGTGTYRVVEVRVELSDGPLTITE